MKVDGTKSLGLPTDRERKASLRVRLIGRPGDGLGLLQRTA